MSPALKYDNEITMKRSKFYEILCCVEQGINPAPPLQEKWKAFKRECYCLTFLFLILILLLILFHTLAMGNVLVDKASVDFND